MKKSPENKGDQKKRRRLVLNRETIKVLEDPALLGLAQGGTFIMADTTTERPTGCT